MSPMSLLPSALPTSKCSELHAFSIVASANELATGWWKGRQLGLVKFWRARRIAMELGATELGASNPGLLSGTQTAMSLGWIANYLFSFCCGLPEKW